MENIRVTVIYRINSHFVYLDYDIPCEADCDVSSKIHQPEEKCGIMDRKLKIK
jgi:hypothetical protein